MKNLTLLSLLFLSCAVLYSQTPQQEINEQVWKPFIRYFSEGNTEAFMDLHSKDVIRFGLEGTPSTLDWETYRASQQRGDERNLRENLRRTIDLRFEYRSAVDTFAYETGFYRTSYEQEGGVRQDFFGKFNVILKKEQGHWKILLDSDHGGVFEADFWNAQPIDGPQRLLVATDSDLPIGAKTIRKQVLVKASPEAVYRAWTTQEGIRQFLGVDSKIEMKVGGAYELYFAPDAPLGSRGSENCQILSFIPDKMLSFSWTAPPDYPEIRNGLHKTIVVINMEAAEAGQTTCTIVHHNWPVDFSGDWPKVYDYFDKAWRVVLDVLKEKIE